MVSDFAPNDVQPGLQASQSNKILTIIHKETTIPGVVGSKLNELGFELDIRAPIFGEPLPHDLENYAAALVFGGYMSVNDDELYLQKETQWIQQVLAAGLPYLGICLGAQLLAKALGAQVTTHAQALEEIGYYSVYATEAGKDLFPSEIKLYQWHKEGFELPEGAVLLARGDTFPHQAFRWGDRAYGVQFHPEMTAEMINNWSSQDELLNAPNAKSRREQLQGHEKYSAQVERWLEIFLKNWLRPDG